MCPGWARRIKHHNCVNVFPIDVGHDHVLRHCVQSHGHLGPARPNGQAAPCARAAIQRGQTQEASGCTLSCHHTPVLLYAGIQYIFTGRSITGTYTRDCQRRQVVRRTPTQTQKRQQTNTRPGGAQQPSVLGRSHTYEHGTTKMAGPGLEMTTLPPQWHPWRTSLLTLAAMGQHCHPALPPFHLQSQTWRRSPLLGDSTQCP
jgi:hypothetical protein